jgi:hypothetical protein
MIFQGKSEFQAVARPNFSLYRRQNYRQYGVGEHKMRSKSGYRLLMLIDALGLQ